MKLIYHSGESVTRGAYWNVATGELIHCDAATDVLSGDAMAFLRIHPVALVLLGPIFGLTFVLFLPFIGFAMIVYTLSSNLLAFVGTHLVREAGFRWQPSMAYFAGKDLLRETKSEARELDRKA